MNVTFGHSQRSRARVASAAGVAVEGLETRQMFAAIALDPTFGSGGKTVTDFAGTTNDAAQQVAFQQDGKIVVLSGVQSGQARIARYSQNGVLDTSFGSGGSVVLPYRA